MSTKIYQWSYSKLQKNIFGFLVLKKLKSLEYVILKEKYLNLRKYDNLLDLNDLHLFLELNILKKFIRLKNIKQLTFLITNF